MDRVTKAEVTLSSDTTIVVTRDFAGPRSLIWRAFTRPEMISRWLLGPPDWSMPVCKVDLRVGGEYYYLWRNDAEGKEFALRGTFDRIEPETLLVSREHFEETEPAGEMKVETRLADNGEATRLEYVITFGSREERDAALETGMTDGMEMSFSTLDRELGSRDVSAG